MKSVWKKGWLGLTLILVGTLGAQVGMIYFWGGRTDYNVVPFEQKNPQAELRVLFLGDSTAVGTGVKERKESVAGWFAQDFPDANIENRGRNGKRLADLDKEFFPNQNDRWSLIVIQLGANDIMHWTPLPEVKMHLTNIVARAKGSADEVVILHSGDVGKAPIFIWPFSWIFSERTKMVRKIYQDIERQQSALYIDLFALGSDDVFLKNIETFYAADHLHLSGRGYRVWYDAIRQEINSAGIDLLHPKKIQ